MVQICNGTACNVKGSESLLEELVAVLGIRPGETTPDAKVTLEQVACVGACGVAPAIVVDGEVHGRMTPRQTRRIAEKLLASPKRERAPVTQPKPAAPVRGLPRALLRRVQEPRGHALPQLPPVSAGRHELPRGYRLQQIPQRASRSGTTHQPEHGRPDLPVQRADLRRRQRVGDLHSLPH